MGLLENKVAIVTGGSRGIGEAIVRQFVEEGATTIFTYKNSIEKANALVEELSQKGSVKGVQCDVADFTQMEQFVSDIVDEFKAIDILVNNAGVTRDNLILRMSEEEWDEVMHNNLKSVFNCTKLVVKPMMRARKGSIINLSSIVGIGGNAGQSNYAASKAGIIGFSKSIAKEMGGRNIRCNVIAPGFIQTEMTDALSEEVKTNYLKTIPLKRFGLPSEIAETAVFLASDKSSYISGQVLSVCGAIN